jgi:hypothetical protein
MTDAEVEAAQKMRDAVLAAEAEKREKLRERYRAHQPSGHLFKRGSAAKTWKKRWCSLERGVLYYYVCEADKLAGKPALGALVLAGATARRPTTMTNKGKYSKTCFRLDLDAGHQSKVVVPLAEDEDEEGGTVDVSDVGVKGRTNKVKFVFAAETSEQWLHWVDAISFWSREALRLGNAINLTEEEFEKLREANLPVAEPEPEPAPEPEPSVESLAIDDDDDEEEEVAPPDEEDEAEAETVAEAPAAPAEPTIVEDADKAELRAWSVLALRHQLRSMGAPEAAFGEGVDQGSLVDLYWSALCKEGKEHDEDTRRFLRLPVGGQGGQGGGAPADREQLVRTWLPCVTGLPLPDGGGGGAAVSVEMALKSGEYLCDFLNALRPGMVPKISREAALQGAHSSVRFVKMRENIGQFLDGCADLGMPQRELFVTADLFDDQAKAKNMPLVLKAFEALARFAHEGIPGYRGPLIGKKHMKKPAADAKPRATHHDQIAAARVVLSGGAVRGGYQAAVSGGR